MTDVNLWENKSLLYSIRTKLWFNVNFPKIIRKIFCVLRRILDYRYINDYKQHYTKLKELHNKHKGERCFVVGMGPSLDKTRFDLIKDEIFIVSNNFYTGIKKFGIKPKYWAVGDKGVFDIHHKELLKQDTTMFLTENASRLFLKHKEHYMKDAKINPIVIKPLGNTETWMTFSKDLTKGAYGGHAVCGCIQVALHLGFKEVYLLGCDCSESEENVHFGGATTFSTSDKVLNEWESVFKRYEVCKKLFEKNNRKIYNATVGGALEVFERRDVKDICKTNVQL